MAAPSPSLKLLDYPSSSDESDTDSNNSSPVTKRLCVEKPKIEEKILLPVPETLLSMFGDIEQNEPNSQSDGRIRTFPHERGNWTTYAYIPCDMIENSISQNLQKVLEKSKSQIRINPIEDFHLSVSRTIILRYHWIDPLMKSLKKRLLNFTRFLVSFRSFRLYANEEKTRTFIGLQVDAGHSQLVSAVSAIDSCLDEFKLPKFYTDPSFHVSIAWCLGDEMTVLHQLLPEFNMELDNFLQTNPNCGQMIVDGISVKSGNKTFKLNFESAL